MRALKRFTKQIIWRRRNRHNFTTLEGDNFPLERVSVGKGTYGPLKVVSFGSSDESLNIGNYCSIADGVIFLLGGEHDTRRVSTYPFNAKFHSGIDAFSKGPIIIEDDVWIGYRSLVISGVRIGRGAVIGAGSIVTSDVEPYMIVAGVPAQPVRSRFPDSVIDALESIAYSKIDPHSSEHVSILTGAACVESINDILSRLPQD